MAEGGASTASKNVPPRSIIQKSEDEVTHAERSICGTDYRLEICADHVASSAPRSPFSLHYHRRAARSPLSVENVVVSIDDFGGPKNTHTLTDIGNPLSYLTDDS